MSYRLIRVFCAAPGNLEKEKQLFQDAAAECNAAEGMAAGCLFVPLSVSLKLKGQDVVDANIRLSDYFLLVLDDTWGPPGKSFEHDYLLAEACRAGAELPMREVIVFLKDTPADRVEADLERFRRAIAESAAPRHHVFRDAAEFGLQVRALLSEWLESEVHPARQAGSGQ
jgi:hypothetical protein